MARKAPPPSSPPEPRKRPLDSSDDDEDRKPSPTLEYVPPPSSSPLGHRVVASPSRDEKKPKLEPDDKPKPGRGAFAASTKAKARAPAEADPVYDDADDGTDEEGNGEEPDGPLEDVVGLERRRIAPSSVEGKRRVRWDPYVRTILRTDARAIYKLKNDYLHALDCETSTNARGYTMFIYSEHEVQQAAYNIQGSKAYFDAYIQRLHANKMLKARNKGKEVSPLDPIKSPLCTVSYALISAPLGWTDKTTRA